MLARMKGIAHFASGLCAATFVPGVVEAAAAGALWIPLAGACAMLPDFLDFRFARFLQRRQADVQPPPDAASDPAAVAAALANAVAGQIALAQSSGMPRVIQLHSRRLGVIDWATWTVRFDAAARRVHVKFRDCGACATAGDFDYAYDGELEAGELGGPALLLAPDALGMVRIEFLPWHRTWSHSLMIALLCGVLAWLLFGPSAGIVSALGFTVHVLEDQLGYMGSNLFWPFTRDRARGLKLLHSGDAIPNFLTVWTSLALILFNLDRATDAPVLDGVPYLLGVVVAPGVLLGMRYVRRRLRASLLHSEQRESAAEDEA